MRSLVMLVTGLTLALAGAALAQDDTGALPGVANHPVQEQPRLGDCSILYFSAQWSSLGDAERISSLGYDVTLTLDPADLNLANLQNYTVVVIFLAGPGLLTEYQDDLAAFTEAGGSLLIHQPNTAGTIDYAPPQFAVTIENAHWCGYSHFAVIVDPQHDIMVGLEDEDLSGDFDHVAALGSGYGLLAENRYCGSPAVAAGFFGDGRVVFDTGNFGLATGDPGTSEYITRFVDYLCRAESGLTPVEGVGGTQALLGEPSPNPFNPRTTLGFSLPQAGAVDLSVFDARGARVTQLLATTLPAGAHRVEWTGTDAQGRAMPSGTYFCRLATPWGTEVRKLGLLR